VRQRISTYVANLTRKIIWDDYTCEILQAMASAVVLCVGGLESMIRMKSLIYRDTYTSKTNIDAYKCLRSIFAVFSQYFTGTESNPGSLLLQPVIVVLWRPSVVLWYSVALGRVLGHMGREERRYDGHEVFSVAEQAW
jgi:hypothetical protein